MVKIVEEEIVDVDGQIRRTRTIEAGRVRVEKADGTVEEYLDVRAEEWPWSPEGTVEWRVFGIPFRSPVDWVSLMNATMTFSWSSGDVILKLGSITLGMQMAQDAGPFLIGKELVD